MSAEVAHSPAHQDPNNMESNNRSEEGMGRRQPRDWLADLKAQVVRRNAAELAPTLSVFHSYAALHNRVLALQQQANERVQLAMQNEKLSARVRELERAAADLSVRSAREVELEAKKDELMNTLQRHLEKENEYYRGLAELSTWKERAAAAEARAAAVEADVGKRNAELALIKKEYLSLREENGIMRSKAADADTTLLNLRAATLKLEQQEKSMKDLEGELARLRAARGGAAGQQPALQRNTDSTQNNAVEQYRNAAAEEEELRLLAEGGPEDTNPANPRSNNNNNSSNTNAKLGSADDNANAFSPYPRSAIQVIEDAHNGAILQTCCFGDSSGTRLVFTSGSDKMIKIWECRHFTGSGGSSSRGANADNNSGGGNSNFMEGSGGGSGGGGSRWERKRFSSGGSIALSLHCSSHYLIAGCVDKVARFWDTRTLRVLELVGHNEKIVSACLSSTAQHGFTASSDSTIKLWDIRTRATLRTLLCQSTANDVTVAGENIFSCHYNGNVICWDRRTAGKSCEVLKAHQRIATCVRISNDGRLCVTLGKDNAISIRDTRMLTRELRNLAPSTLTVNMNWSRLALSPDSKVCAVGSGHGQVVCCALEKSYEADIARACPYFTNNFSPLPAAAGDERRSSRNSNNNNNPDDGVMTVLERGGHDKDSPIPCVAWGREPHSPLVSIGEDRRVVVWQ